jgi:hypothetical protein
VEGGREGGREGREGGGAAQHHTAESGSVEEEEGEGE